MSERDDDSREATWFAAGVEDRRQALANRYLPGKQAEHPCSWQDILSEIDWLIAHAEPTREQLGEARLEGARMALEECQTCGCTGLMEADASGGAGPMVEETCGECEGTGLGAMGQLLRDARRGGARAMQERCAAIADGADTLVGRTYQPDHPRVAQRVARAIRALKPEDV